MKNIFIFQVLISAVLFVTIGISLLWIYFVIIKVRIICSSKEFFEKIIQWELKAGADPASNRGGQLSSLDFEN